jgi:hypothetical protein
MKTRTALFLLALSIPSLQGGCSLSAHPLPVPSAPQGTPAVGPSSSPTPLPPVILPSARALLFADGSVGCTGADDRSQPVGIVTLSPRAGGMAFRVQLRLGASMAYRPYFVELSLDGSCDRALRFFDFHLDGGGNGVFTGFYPVSAGPQAVLVNVVSQTLVPPPDPKLRELAPGGLMLVDVPDGGSSLLTLGFDGATGSLPWSEQGFTFTGNGSVSGQQLSMVAYGDHPYPCQATVMTLTRTSGGTFDALGLSTDFSYLEDGYAVVSSNLGGIYDLGGGPTALVGPEWEGITSLGITVYGIGLCGTPCAWLDADDFIVRSH